MPQNINLNVSPYYDDFDENKNYYKVLFKPGYSIQARELTTLQSILQNQIEKFGQYFFKDGALLSGSIGYDSEYHCVELNSIHLGIPVTEYLTSLVGKTIKGQTSNVTATIENVINENDSERKNNTLYVKYITSSQTDFTTKKFVDGENLIVQETIAYTLGVLNSGNTFATTISNNSTSIGSAIKITDGVYFVRGFFIKVNASTLILNQYNNSPSYRVGLLIKEAFATASNEYSDLLDNSQGYYNFAAPGADRLIVETDLIKKPLDDFNDDNFIQLAKVEDGILESITKNADYNKLLDEFARRTYDESGDYYITPFEVNVKESLNDQQGNNGIFSSNQLTKDGNTPSDGLACLSISPGKAYVRGYEIEKTNSSIIDIQKARDTGKITNESVNFNFGNKLQLNNVYGQIKVGLTSDSYVNLYNGRTETVGVSSGSLIGVARLYDLSLDTASYADQSTVFDATLYDIQTYTNVEITTGFSSPLDASSYIEGKNSGASGFLVTGISTTATNFNLYQVSGRFIENEGLLVNGLESNRLVKTIKDYSLNDVLQITSYNSSSFTADTVLSKATNISPNSQSYTISAGSVTGISTITTVAPNNFYSTLKIGDILSYTKPGVAETLITYNRIKSVSSNLLQVVLEATSSVNNVNTGTLPADTIVVNDLKKVTPDVDQIDPSLYSRLNNRAVSSLDLSSSDITFRKTLTPVTISNSTVYEWNVFDEGSDSILVPFDERSYSLVYSDGTIESLTPQKIIPNYNKDNLPEPGIITLRNLSSSAILGNCYLTVTYKKVGVKPRNKIFNRCSTLTLNKTRVGINTADTGLTFSSVYGCRIEDDIISLNIPEVTEIIGIYESSGNLSPELPSISITDIQGNIANAIKGEKIIGSSTNAIGTLVEYGLYSTISLCHLNDKTFLTGETITFEESGITARVVTYNPGDRNILNNYDLDNGSRDTHLDFSRLVKKPSVASPTKAIKVVFNHYTIDSNDNGSFVGVNSYDLSRYGKIPSIDVIKCSDILDFRPRVLPYNTSSSISPFEFRSRIFSETTSSSKEIVAKNSFSILSYDYYLPRIDKLFLTNTGEFKLAKGIPSSTPKIPENLDYSLEIATLNLPPYTFKVEDIQININSHKRYTMSDISNLETRINDIETYTYLSVLESNTQNLIFRDPDTGNNKFKCGFYVDNFSNINLENYQDPIYRSSLDPSNKLLYPSYSSSYVDLEIDESSLSNVTKSGNVATLSYEDTNYISNTYATSNVTINPFTISTWFGSVKLEPSTDTWIENSSETLEDDLKWGSWNDWVTPENTSYKKLRSRNIGIFADNLKPYTLFYSYFDNVNVSNLIVPKLIEIQMISGSFTVGEVVEGVLGNTSIIFRVAKQNHKYGPYDNPTQVYTSNYYNNTNGFPLNYSLTSTILNVDIESLNLKSNTNYYGNIAPQMILRGNTSGAVAKVSNLRIVSDDKGSFIGSLYIPDPSVPTNVKFNSGRKTLVLTSVLNDLNPTSLNESSAEVNFTSNGYIENLENNALSLRTLSTNNGYVSNDNFREITSSSNSKGKDPLAQTFQVAENVGVFITKCNIYFSQKEAGNIPITLQIRTVRNGIPSQRVLPSSEVVLYPSQVSTSTNGQVPTTFTFKSPVFLEGNKEYSITLITSSNQYKVWTSEMGIVTPPLGDIPSDGDGNERVVTNRVSQIPFIKSLFKSQNASSWTGTEYESLKFDLYRARFNTGTGTIIFNNPSSTNIYNLNQITRLESNSLNSFSRSLIVTLNANLNTSDLNYLNSGYTLTQNSNPTFSSKVIGILGKLSLNGSLNIVNSGIGFTSGITTYQNVDLISLTGNGSGGKISLGVGTGVAYYATITDGGAGYAIGDSLTIDYNQTQNLGKDLILTVPNTSGILTERNSLYLDEVQGNLTISSGNLIVNETLDIGKYPSETPEVITDGLHFQIKSKDHGMYSKNNLVAISGVESDIPPTRLISDLNTTASSVFVESVDNFKTFEGYEVNIINPGYLIINNEIIEYTGINTSTNAITISARGQYSTTTTRHYTNDLVFKYEFNGVSLEKINKTHDLSDVNYEKYPLELDSYYIKLEDVGIYFHKTKSGGSYNSLAPQTKWNAPRASRNIPYSILRPVTNILAVGDSNVSSKVRTYTSTSVDGNEVSFLDNGYEDFSLESDNIFKSMRAIYSRVDELEYINSSNNKSLGIQLTLSSSDDRISPVIDLERVGVIAVSNRINNPISDYSIDSRVNKILEDPNAAIYVTDKIYFERPADSLKVIFEAYRHSTNKIRVAYRLFRSDTPEDTQGYELFPGYDNMNEGLSDRDVPPSVGEEDFKTYEYTVNNTAPFTGVQIKIIRTGTNQAIVPKIKDLRVVAAV